MSHVELPATVFRFDGLVDKTSRNIPVEVPLNIIFGNRPYAVMMVSPSHLEDFAVGFTFTEGIVELASHIEHVEIRSASKGLEAVVRLKPEAAEVEWRERTLTGQTSCGVCGVTSLNDLPQASHTSRAETTVSLAAIERALASIESAQTLNILTRAVHAAAWCDTDGAILHVREDVGRHCALDKLIGARLRDGQAADGGFLLLTSRCSYELIDKAAAYGTRTVVTISAPTSFAVERARHYDITLLSIARRDGLLAFHGAERVRRTSMDAAKLVHMANEIAAAFRLQPEPARLVANHLQAFWAPSLRQGLIAYAATGGPGIDPLVAKAVVLLQLTPTS